MRGEPVAFRDGPFDDWKVPLTWTAALAVAAAGVIAVMLMLGDRRETFREEGYGPARGAFDTVAAPANNVLAAPVRWFGAAANWVDDYFFAVSENRRLKQELAELQKIRDAYVALKDVNKRYEALLNVRTEPPIAMVTARSVSESRGPFANARLIDAGSRQGVLIGHPVINEHGLVGRVTGTTSGVSRVLLLTDAASRVPVLVNGTDARAILSGDGGANPRLEFLRGQAAVKEGSQILTSGDGGMFPRGLPVGVAAKSLDGGWRVKLYSERGAVDYVRVLKFEDFSQLADPQALTPPPLTALQTAAQPPAPVPAPVVAQSPAAPAAGAVGSGARPPASTPARPATSTARPPAPRQAPEPVAAGRTPEPAPPRPAPSSASAPAVAAPSSAAAAPAEPQGVQR
jgi:rod shape-determining protein MreC